MRRALVLAGVAACYSTAPDRCAVTLGNPACADGGAGGDVPGEQPVQPVCPMPLVPTGEHMITNGIWFAARLDGDRFAIKFAETLDANSIARGSILGTDQEVVNGTPFPVIFQGTMALEYASPRLSYDGLELFARTDANNVHAIVRATRTTGTPTWSAPVDLVLKDLDGNSVIVPAGVDPSPPTLTSPRRMLLVYGQSGFDEYQEDTAAGAWNLVHSHMHAFTAAFEGQAQLTSDGLQLIYISGGAINVIPRPTIDSDFDMTSTPVTTGVPAFRPYVLADCKHLFYDDNVGAVRLVDL